LRILEEMYDRPISMYSCDVVGFGGEEHRDFSLPIAHYNDVEEEKLCKDIEPLRLSFHGNNHYNAVVVLNAPAIPKDGISPEINDGRIRRLRRGGPITPDRKRSFRAPSMSVSRSTPK
jgi:hypothetical protein